MTDYTELVKALRCCGNVNTDCTVCPWDKYNFGMCAEKLLMDAAAAIEELQNKVVELEEQLNDAEIAADENGRQVEELQAEVDTLKRTDIKRCQECLYLGQPVGEQLLPKLGEWELIDGAEPMRWGCSRCKYMSWETLNYCPRCGAKMTEVQE